MKTKLKDPREVGKTFRSYYWGQTYIVLARWETQGTDWFLVRWSDGSITRHCTAFDPRDKEVVSEDLMLKTIREIRTRKETKNV